MPKPGEFTIGDIGFLTAMPGEDLLVPSSVWKRRGETMPKQITVGTDTFPLADLVVEDYSREFWFDYFRKEAWSKLQSAGKDKDQIVKFLNKAFVKPDSFKADEAYKRYVIPRGPFDQLFAGDDEGLRKTLDILLKLGFSSIEVGTDDSAKVSNQGLLNRASVVDKNKADSFKLVWRGGEREWDNVRKFGMAAAARYEADAIKFNMRQDWNPFNDPAVRSRVHFRNNLLDNCLFTTVSLTDDWKCALCYPKMAQNTEINNVGKAIDNGQTWEQQYKSAAPGRVGKVTYTNGKSDYRIVSVTRLALLVLDGLVLDTGGAQKDYNPDSSYPEVGANAVPGSNVFGMQTFVRLFNGTSDDEGFTAYFRSNGSKLVTRSDVLAAFGDQKAVDDFFPKIVAELNKGELIGANRINLKWTSSGTAVPPTKLEDWTAIEFNNGTRIAR